MKASKWIDAKNFGGLCYPKKSLVSDVKIMDGIFRWFHMTSEDGLLRCNNVTKKLIVKIQKKFPPSKYPRSMIKKFAVSRTIFRMRAMQKILASKNAESLRALTKKNDSRY